MWKKGSFYEKGACEMNHRGEVTHHIPFEFTRLTRHSYVRFSVRDKYSDELVGTLAVYKDSIS